MQEPSRYFSINLIGTQGNSLTMWCMVGAFRLWVQALLRDQAVGTLRWHLTTLPPRPMGCCQTRQDKTANKQSPLKTDFILNKLHKMAIRSFPIFVYPTAFLALLLNGGSFTREVFVLAVFWMNFSLPFKNQWNTNFFSPAQAIIPNFSMTSSFKCKLFLMGRPLLRLK